MWLFVPLISALHNSCDIRSHSHLCQELFSSEMDYSMIGSPSVPFNCRRQTELVIFTLFHYTFFLCATCMTHTALPGQQHVCVKCVCVCVGGWRQCVSFILKSPTPPNSTLLHLAIMRIQFSVNYILAVKPSPLGQETLLKTTKIH